MSPAKRMTPMTDDEVRHVARALVNGSVYTDLDVRDAHLELGLVFLPLAFGMVSDPESIHPDDIPLLGRVYAIVGEDRTFNRSVNGFPIFASARLALAPCWARVVATARSMHASLQSVPVAGTTVELTPPAPKPAEPHKAPRRKTK